eukprot:scaffold34018_cov75-Phaeocystis_antarctica.AAC.5
MAAKAAELKRISACSSDHSSSLRVQSVIESSQRDSHAAQAGGPHSKRGHAAQADGGVTYLNKSKSKSTFGKSKAPVAPEGSVAADLGF